MYDFFRALFGTDFMPHLYCLRGAPGVLWLHVASDLAIAAAYFAIPMVLFDVVLKRRDLLFRRIALLFVIFIAACGTTHVLAVWTIWVPVYRFEGMVKVFTAVVSVSTAVVLLRVRPLIFQLPSIAQLAEEIRMRELAEAEAREKEVRFRAFVDSVTDYAIYMLDPDGVILSWNSGAQRLKGYTAEEVVGQSFSKFFTDGEQQLGVPREILRIARETGGFEGEGWRVRKDGTRFLANVHLRPLFEGGELRGFSKVTRDLTEAREAEEKYRILLEAAPDAIVIVNRQGKVNYVNAQAERLFGYNRVEIEGQPMDMLAPPRLQAAQAVYLQRLLMGGEHPGPGMPPEVFGLRRNGIEFPVEFSVSPLETKDGGVLLFAIRDMTERKRTEERFRAVLEAGPDPLFITDREDRIVYMNRRAEEVFGLLRSEALGTPTGTLIPERLRAERAEERRQFFLHPERMEAAIARECFCLRADGSEFPVEASYSPLDTADGPVILTSVRDISERKRTEARFRALLEAVPDGIVMYRPPAEIAYVNCRAEAMFGYSREELLGQPADILVPERIREDRHRERETLFRSLLECGGGDNAEHLCLRKDGTEFPVEASMQPLDTPEGPVILASVRDITDRKKTEARFRALLEAIPDAIVMIDPEGRIQFVNHQAEAMYGRGGAELLGQPGEILVPERVREERRAYRSRLIAGAVAHPAEDMGSESVGVRKDGSEFPTEFSFTPLETAEGKMYLYTIRDITERRRSEARFRALLDSAPDAMVISNREGVIELTNRQAERIFGYTREEMVGRRVDILIPPDLRGDYRQDEEAFLGGDHERKMGAGLELRARRKDGSEFPVEISFSPLEGPNGLSMTAAIRDITDRVKSEIRFRALLEAAPDAVILYGQPDRIVYVNRRAEELLGWDRAEILGKPADVLIPADVREQRRSRRQEIFAMASAGANVNGERPYVRKDGSQFEADITASPIETPDGPVLLAFVRDTTERKKTEARFRALLESAPDAMVIVNPEGKVVLANFQTEQMFGYTREELVGQPVDILVPAASQAAHAEHRARFFTDPRQRAMGAGLDLLAVRKDGSEFPVEIRLSPLEGMEGTSVTAAIRDISERKLAAQQLAQKMAELRQSNEALEQFAHIASHDLQEPLRMVASYTQLLSKRYKGRLDADADEFIHYAVDGTQRMKRLIEDLLLYSRAGRGAPALKELESEEALREALWNLKAAVEDSGAEVSWEALPRVMAAETQLVQLFQNLVGNAIKYRGERPPRIHIAAKAVDAEWIFSVADNGIGIETKHFDRIFAIFQRLHGRGEYEGTGIGLAICKRILQQQGGRIWVESEPGQGSVFYFTLPLRGRHDV